ncbi:MAG: branched-chain amino acid ABC transporter permease [Clostridiales bacterium]|nr:branched-chain amino acid ABC transporter permease [Clostridiales bacterium]
MLKNMKKTTKSNLITYGMVIAAFIIVQILTGTGNISSLLEGLMVPLCIYSILAVSLNLVVGFLGELSLGHAGFMCVGAFTSAFFSKCVQDTITVAPLRFFLALLVGAAAAAVFGIIIGIPVLRLKGDYLAIVTLAFGEIIKNLVNVVWIGRDSNGFHFSMKDVMSLNMETDGQVIVNGPQGITGTPQDSTFLVGIILVLVTLFIVTNLVHSRDGRAIMAIRDNRIAAESVGINVTKYKLMAFTISAALAGLAGVLYAHNLSTLTATTNNFGYNQSIMILVFVVLGGIGNIRGSVIAAVVLTLLPELLRGLSDYRMLIYAIVLIVMMLFNWAPKSIEWREKHLAFLKKKKNSPSAASAGADGRKEAR